MEDGAMRCLMATMVVVAMATPAGAQAPKLFGGGGNSPKLKTDVEVRQEKERERAYESGIAKIPDAKGKTDPWGNVRSSTGPQPAQRPASR
jgi:hypothetical protein